MILVGATMTYFALSHRAACLSWLGTAEQLRETVDGPVEFFAAFELDARGLGPFTPVMDRLTELGGRWWTYTYGSGRDAVTSANRFGPICAGRNLITDRAVIAGASHILYLDADMCPPGDALPKLLEMDHPLVGGEVPTYNLHGKPVPHYPYPVQSHMNTAGFLLVARALFIRQRWRWDPDAGLTDDPAYHADARDLHGIPTYVRKDVVGRHWPESIPPLEGRYSDADRALIW